MTTLNKTLVLALLGTAYVIITFFFPDFPISKDVFVAFMLWLLIQLGVDVTEARVRAFLVKRSFLKK